MDDKTRTRLRVEANKLVALTGMDQYDADHLVYERYVAGGIDEVVRYVGRINDDLVLVGMSKECARVGYDRNEAFNYIDEAYWFGGMAAAENARDELLAIAGGGE